MYVKDLRKILENLDWDKEIIFYSTLHFDENNWDPINDTNYYEWNWCQCAEVVDWRLTVMQVEEPDEEWYWTRVPIITFNEFDEYIDNPKKEMTLLRKFLKKKYYWYAEQIKEDSWDCYILDLLP